MTITGHVWPFDSLSKFNEANKPLTQHAEALQAQYFPDDYSYAKGPDTYLNGARHGWPHDHSVDDTYECPPHVWKAPKVYNEAPVYKAEFGTDGSSSIYLHIPRRLIATFETHADAQLAAEALNNHKGY